MTGSKTKTFVIYEDYEPYESLSITREVSTRDIQHPDFKKTFEGDGFFSGGIPDTFQFFDADVTTEDGEEVISNERNASPEYIVAERVISVDDFKKEQLQKIEAMKKDKGSFLTRLFNRNRPVMAWYIDGVEKVLKEAETSKAAYIAETTKDSYYLVVTDDMTVIDKNLQQLYPVAAKEKIAPTPEQHRP